MDWSLAIRRNRAALLTIVAAIVALLARAGEGRVPRRLRNAALALLRPAESAARRLILIAARGLAVAPRPALAFAIAPGGAGREQAGDCPEVLRPRAFRLFDPKKRFVFRRKVRRPLVAPRIRSFWNGPLAPVTLPPAPPPPAKPSPPDPDALVDAARLRLRLAALERALADLAAQARRLARWRAREARRNAVLRPHRPLRLGRPPGWRARPAREVDQVLRECHALASDALAPDTS
jgi:hypothetical protein